MFPSGFPAVLAILLSIVPGFVGTSVWARARTWKGSSADARGILHALAFSLVVQVLLVPLTLLWLYPVRGSLEAYPERVATWFALAVLVIPVGGGLLLGRWSDYLFRLSRALNDSPEDLTGWRQRLAKLWSAPASPSIWDWLWTARPPYGRFLIIEFQDGTKVAGVFARDSMAITSPEEHGLFLVSEWIIDEAGDITGPLPGSKGILIRDVPSIRSIRVLAEEGEEHGRAPS